MLICCNFQERLLGAALGSALVGIIILENKRNIYETISENNAKFGNQSQVNLQTLLLIRLFFYLIEMGISNIKP